MANLKNPATNEAQNSLEPKSVTTVDQRGQMVISREIRELCGIKPGDRLALFAENSHNSGSFQILMVRVNQIYDKKRIKSIKKTLNSKHMQMAH